MVVTARMYLSKHHFNTGGMGTTKHSGITDCSLLTSVLEKFHISSRKVLEKSLITPVLDLSSRKVTFHTRS